MADSYNKKEREKKRAKRKKEKAEKKAQRKLEGSEEPEFMYLDENGNLTTTPPDPTAKKEEVKLEDIQIGVPKKEDVEDDKFRKEGRVKFFNQEKGYGFICESSTNTDYFVHSENINGGVAIKENDKVSFELGSGPKGPMAVKVDRL